MSLTSRLIHTRVTMNLLRSVTIAAIALSSYVALSSNAALAEGAAPCALPRPQDSLWVVSCRSGCGPWQQRAEQMGYWRYDPAGRWAKSSLAELTATDDPAVNTTIFVHGNRIDWCESFAKCWNIYRELARCADDRPIRFIALSWPSDTVRGPINDARVKASLTDPSGYCLGWLVANLDPQAPVSMWGHSFGARIVTGALHLLGGGQLAGLQLPNLVARKPAQAVLIVAAIDNDWLIPGHHHGAALSQTEQMLLVNNCSDILLKRYHLVYHRRSGAEALGFTGMARGWLPPGDQPKISQVEASGYVGRQHVLDPYLYTPALMARMRQTLLGAPPAAPTVTAEEPTEEDAELLKVAETD